MFQYWYIARDENDEPYCTTHRPGRTIYIIITVIILYFVPVAVMAASYSAIGYKLWNRRVPGEQSYISQRVQQRSRRKVDHPFVFYFPDVINVVITISFL